MKVTRAGFWLILPILAFVVIHAFVSAEELAPPAGTYDPPSGYPEVQFDLLSSMQRGRR